MALENRSFSRQLVYLLLTFVVIVGLVLILSHWGW